MNRRYFWLILGVTLACLLLILAFFTKHEPMQEHEPVRVVRSPFLTYINGIGIVEPASGNIYIGIPFNRIVKKVNVKVNEKVKKGEDLIELDNQDLIASLHVKEKEHEKTVANLQKLEALPRKEDLVIAEEALKKAQVAFNESQTQYEMVANLPNPHAISKEEHDKRLYKYQQAEAEMKERQAQYEKIKAGAWKSELTIASHEIEQAQADIEAIRAEIERTYIKSPIDGTVLQIKIHEGETVASDHSKAIIVLGNVDDLNLRVSIDQFNVTALQPDVPAIAYRQGDHTTEFPLKFLHVEPLMVPKKYLTNESEEKVDTQVLEILYRIEKKDSRLFVGEQMDVFIDVEKK